MKYQRGLCIGKFCPPHLGHHFLIESALKLCEEVIVVVCDNPTYPIPALLRASWLMEDFPDPRVDVRIVKDLDHENSELWAQYTQEFLPGSPDVVFTSEEYGHAYAHHLGCDHVQVDPSRLTVPISATKIKSDPAAYWQYISPAVRAYYTRRVVILGAESTGTTTLTRALAKHHHSLWVPEYGRTYSQAKLSAGTFEQWDTDDFTQIALTQIALEDSAARQTKPGQIGPLLFCDTDVLATTIWHERYMETSSKVVELLARRPYDLYVLTWDDVPFVQDGIRDGEHLRRWMTQRFVEVLSTLPTPFIVAKGDVNTRLATVNAHLSTLLPTPSLPLSTV